MTGHGAKFGRKKEEAIVALLTTRTVDEAARAAKISAKTLMRWQKEPEFDLAFRAAKRAAFGQAIARLHQLSSAAVSTLGKVMLEGGTPPATRVRAADSILNHTIKAIENEDIETRVSALERAAEESGRRS
jgi:histone acetyltransferase (RNA polymerase elongator complex component)